MSNKDLLENNATFTEKEYQDWKFFYGNPDYMTQEHLDTYGECDIKEG